MIGFHEGNFLDGKISERVDTDNGLSGGLVAKRDLERYYHLLTGALPELSEAEAMAICDVCNGYVSGDNPKSPGLMWVSVDDAIRGDGLADKWGIATDFGERLRAMPEIARIALVDAAERFWRTGDDERDVEKFFRVKK